MKDIPENWSRTRLADISEIIRGVTYKKAQASESSLEGHLPILRATNIQENHLVLDQDLIFVPQDLVSEKQQLREGDIVVATSSGSKHLVGKTAQVKKAWSGSFGAFCAAIRPSSEIDHHYLGYFFESREYKDFIAKQALGVNINNLRRGDLEEISVPIAPLEQQKRIVAEIEKQFSRLDEAVANLKRVKANLKRYKAAVLKAAVEGKLVDTSIKYDHEPLQNLIGRIHQGWSPKCDRNREPGPDEWAVITTTAVQPMQYVDCQGKPLPNDLEPRPHLEVKNGDFLVTRKGPRVRAGVACLVRKTRHRLMVCDTVYRFRCDESKVIPAYLEIGLNAPSVINAIDRQKAGINESGVSLTHSKLGGIEIPVPPLESQSEIVTEVERHLTLLRGAETQVDTNLLRAERLRQSILSKAFSGQLSGDLIS